MHLAWVFAVLNVSPDEDPRLLVVVEHRLAEQKKKLFKIGSKAKYFLCSVSTKVYIIHMYEHVHDLPHSMYVRIEKEEET